MTPVEFRPEAVAEILEARAWNLNRSPQVAVRLLDEVDSAIQRVVADPQSLPLYDEVNRFLRIRTLPDTLFFRLNSATNTVEILAFAHLRRWPRYWRNR